MFTVLFLCKIDHIDTQVLITIVMTPSKGGTENERKKDSLGRVCRGRGVDSAVVHCVQPFG